MRRILANLTHTALFKADTNKLSKQAANAVSGEINKQCAVFSAIISNKKYDTQKENPEPAQHLTAERLHDLARKWKRAQSAERAVALFTYSPEYGVQTAVLGCDEHLTEIVTSGVRLRLATQLRATEPDAHISITSEDTAAQKSASFWQRLRTWFLPFNIER